MNDQLPVPKRRVRGSSKQRENLLPIGWNDAPDSPLRAIVDITVREIDRYGLSLNSAIEDRTKKLFDQVNQRIDELEKRQVFTSATLRQKLDEPAVRRLIAEAVDIGFSSPRDEVPAVLGDLIARRLAQAEDGPAARLTQRAVRMMDSLSTDELLLLGGIGFLNDAAFLHPQSARALDSLSRKDIGGYSKWLGDALNVLMPSTPSFPMISNVVSLGLAEYRQSEEPGAIASQGTSLDALVTRFGMNPLQFTVPPQSIDPLSASDVQKRTPFGRARELLMPTGNGVQLSFNAPILANYQLTPLGRLLSNVVLSRLTDIAMPLDGP